MKKTRSFLLAAGIVLALATLSFAQEGCECPKFGIRAGFNLVDFSFGIKETDKETDKVSFGFGGGVAVNVPIADFLSFNPELNFYYRKLVSMNRKDEDTKAKYERYLDEFALSIPAMLRFAPNGVAPFYLAAGVQLDIPFLTKTHTERTSEGQTIISAGQKTYERAEVDFGIAFGLGYNITPDFGIDLRCVIGLTGAGFAREYEGEDGKPHKDKDKSSLNQYGLGATYFF